MLFIASISMHILTKSLPCNYPSLTILCKVHFLTYFVVYVGILAYDADIMFDAFATL